jgi:transposase-like protein
MHGFLKNIYIEEEVTLIEADLSKIYLSLFFQLVVNGVVSQSEIMRAFGVSKISVKRYVKRYREEGAKGFFKPRKVHSSTVLTAEVLRDVQRCLDEGQSVSHISKEMDLKADTLNKAIRDGRLHRNKKKPVSPS